VPVPVEEFPFFATSVVLYVAYSKGASELQRFYDFCSSLIEKELFLESLINRLLYLTASIVRVASILLKRRSIGEAK
jgi:hypothetical protein